MPVLAINSHGFANAHRRVGTAVPSEAAYSKASAGDPGPGEKIALMDQSIDLCCGIPAGDPRPGYHRPSMKCRAIHDTAQGDARGGAAFVALNWPPLWCLAVSAGIRRT